MLSQISRSIRHRGPDDEGFALFSRSGETLGCFGGPDTPDSAYRGTLPYSPKATLPEGATLPSEVAFVHRRLSILDLSDAGHGPMTTQEGRLWITYNGEIYNYLELRRELESHGYAFKTGTDTEVLLRAYEAWGPDCLNRFVGMFAFALFDSRKKQLFLARDFFGIKPLYYLRTDRLFAFGSEIKAFAPLPGKRNHANPDRVFKYLRFGITDFGAETFFEGVHQLPAGHFAILDLSSRDLSIRKYWSPTAKPELRRDLADVAQELRSLFERNIELHLRSDVPVGVALSGGIDSSAIVASMRRSDPKLDIRCFSYVAEDPAIREEKWAKLAADAAQARLFLTNPSGSDLSAEIGALVLSQDEPFSSTSIFAQKKVFELAHRNGIKVMLDGQGADEIFAGYWHFVSLRLASLIRDRKAASAARLIRSFSRLPGSSTTNMLARTFAEFVSPLGLARPLRKISGRSLVPNWMNADWVRSSGLDVDAPHSGRGGDFLREGLLTSLVSTSLPSLLRYEDRNSMAYSIESRVPFLTPSLVNFVLSLPGELLVNDQAVTKVSFREAMKGIVPAEILQRKDKLGFATPERKWLGELKPLIDSALADDFAASTPLNLPLCRAQWKEIQEGKRAFDSRVWRWTNLMLWSRHHEVAYL